MGSEIEMSMKLDTAKMVVPQNVVLDSQLLEVGLGNCESNREDDMFHTDGSPGGVDHSLVNARGDCEDLEVDIVGNLVANEGKDRNVERESEDTTENSSSFGCTDSGDGAADASGDIEVESELRNDKASLMGFDRFTDIFGNRKKKVTPYWRQHIRPLMWRCKWAELRIRELQHQASKYYSEIEECDKRKQVELEKNATEEHVTKSVPFVFQNVAGKVMKRKKRKRVEETADLASYTTCHHLFSYFVSKKTAADPIYLDDIFRTGKPAFGSSEFGIDLLEFKDNDAFERILRKVEDAQVHVRQLRGRMENVVKECTENFASDKSSCVPLDPSTSCGPKSVLPHVTDEALPLGSVATTCQWPSNKLALPETTVSISGEGTPRPGAIKTTDHHKIGMKREEVENDTLICNRPVKEEFNNSEDVQAQRVVEPCSASPAGKAKRGQHVPDSSPQNKVTMFQEQPALKVRSSLKLTTPKNKRKRGRRKARTGRWSRRTSG